MFFSLSKVPDTRFPFSDVLGDWIFNHDDGWTPRGNSWSKGYRYEEISHGNFCRIEYKDKAIDLMHDLERSFPLWWNDRDKILTNLSGTGEKIWADSKVSLHKDSIEIKKTDIIGKIDLSPISYKTAHLKISENLDRKFIFLKNEKAPIKIFLSGGVDTLGLFSNAKKHSIEFELLDHEYFAYDYFTNQTMQQIQSDYWAYKQIHHWKQPCFLVTGGCGDEFMFRGPATIALWLAWHDIDFIGLLGKNSGYHSHYFGLEKNLKIFHHHYENRKKLQKKYPEKKSIAAHLIDMNLNDHQHWHLGNTITWTPFKDIEIFKLLLRVDIQEFLCQFIDAKMSKDLIDASYLSILSEQKNHMTRQHLHHIKIS